MKEELLKKLASNKQKLMECSVLAKSLSALKGDSKRLFDQALVSLIAEGDVIEEMNGVVGLSERLGYLKGILDLKAAGYGFLKVEGRDDDLFIPAVKVKDAYTQDLCLAKVNQNRFNHRQEGEIIRVLKRHLVDIVGEYFQGAVFIKNQPERVFFKVVSKPKGLLDHSLVKAKIVKYSRSNILDVEIEEVYGLANEPGMEIIAVVKRLGVPTDFPEAVLEEVQTIPERVQPSDLSGRVDLRNELLYTIDGDDTKDIDDAISLKRLASGNYLLGVHIADVSYYVKEDSPLDQEAFKRGTSVYLADRVIPMLPKELSNGICSLNPGVDRLAMSCQMEITKEAEVIAYEIFPSVIQSRQQLTYSEVNKVLEGLASDRITDPTIIQSLLTMNELAKILLRVRNQMGSINFETIEPKILFNAEGEVDDIVILERGDSEKLIEEFMLVANQVIASEYSRRKLPFLYRIHEEPDPEKLTSLFQLAMELKLVEETPKKITPKALQMLLEAVEGSLYEKVINTLMLRSMAKAKYSEMNIGHYGLAFPDYTHFTSPIRRYPDLMVHRMIRSYQGEIATAVQDHFRGILDEIATQTSATERRAMLAEREVDDMKKAEFMEHHIDEHFQGIISTITRFGMFVELPNTVEGLVHISTFKEAMVHNEEKMELYGISTRTLYTIGKEVGVKLVKADKVTGKVDFILDE
ncbi:MAG: ribonuclease R [Candidatus Izemoplasmatales bacterium]|jgi:ribonuclease R|nr:ribonuclease R [Candidatus Izemoplasmatales bacterium]NLF49449.1 ribonuclease R [Acholeplasmataceae bacterium]